MHPNAPTQDERLKESLLDALSAQRRDALARQATIRTNQQEAAAAVETQTRELDAARSKLGQIATEARAVGYEIDGLNGQINGLQRDLAAMRGQPTAAPPQEYQYTEWGAGRVTVVSHTPPTPATGVVSTAREPFKLTE